MDLSDARVLLIEDSVYKASDIKRALRFNGILEVFRVSNQEEAWNEIYKAQKDESKVDIIVTDMHYPLHVGKAADEEAGFKLIDCLEKEKIQIPVIICSTRNFSEPRCAGSVWYNELRDLELDFKAVLQRLM